MSRIDEALSRARSSTSATPPIVPPTVGGDAEFPPETSDAAPASIGDVAPESPLGAEQRESGAALGSAQEGQAVIDVDPDLRRLPSAEKLMLDTDDGTPIEQYRRLAARLLMAQAEKGTRLVMVTSGFPGEGKTLTATNLALTLSESYKRGVLLIDADLRRPSVHQLFQVPNVSGLNDGLREEGERKIPLLTFTDNLSILTAGRPDPDPMSVLSGDRMRRVLEEARGRFEWVIIDTPPVALLTDARLLTGLVDAVVLVIEAGRTPLPAIKKAVEAVGRERVLGVVLNRVDTATPLGNYDYYRSYQTVGRI